MSETTADAPIWHTLTGRATAQELAVDPAQGLTQAEVDRRVQQYGPNVLSEAEKESLWLAFL